MTYENNRVGFVYQKNHERGITMELNKEQIAELVGGCCNLARNYGVKQRERMAYSDLFVHIAAHPTDGRLEIYRKENSNPVVMTDMGGVIYRKSGELYLILNHINALLEQMKVLDEKGGRGVLCEYYYQL